MLVITALSGMPAPVTSAPTLRPAVEEKLIAWPDVSTESTGLAETIIVPLAMASVPELDIVLLSVTRFPFMAVMVVPLAMPWPLTLWPTTRSAAEFTLRTAFPLFETRGLKLAESEVTALRSTALESVMAPVVASTARTVVPLGMPVPVTVIPGEKPETDPMGLMTLDIWLDAEAA